MSMSKTAKTNAPMMESDWQYPMLGSQLQKAIKIVLSSSWFFSSLNPSIPVLDMSYRERQKKDNKKKQQQQQQQQQ